jgi:hypothetical protein
MPVLETVSQSLMVALVFRRLSRSVRVTKQIESAIRKRFSYQLQIQFAELLMNAVGIDVSKGKSTVANLRPLGKSWPRSLKSLTQTVNSTVMQIG